MERLSHGRARREKDMKQIRGIWEAALGLLILGLFSGCGDQSGGEEAAQGPPGGPGRRPPVAEAAVPVKAEAVERGAMAAYVQTHARLEAERWVDVLARTTGMVQELAVEEGDRVAEGQILVRLEKESLHLRLQQAQVALKQVRASYERIQALHERKMVSESEFDGVRHQLENVQVAFDEAELNLTYADIRAPISGVVMQRSVEVGDLVRTNQQLFAVADVEPLLARIYIPEKRMLQIREGQEARILVESLPEQNFTGRIRMISPGVDPESGTVKVTLEIPSDRGLLKPGMFTSVRIITEEHPRALIIPKKGLILETDEDDVFMVAEGRARRVPVELGFVDKDRVEVLSGLDEGDLVVTVGQEGLKDGTAVRLVGAAPLAVATPEGQAGERADSTGQEKP
jgi:membrane fusion protein (multidrug efflux system)